MKNYRTNIKILLLILLGHNYLQAISIKNLIEGSCVLVANTMRFFFTAVLEAPVMNYRHQWQHALEMQDAPLCVQNFIENEIARMQLVMTHTVYYKIDTDWDCLLYSPSLPQSDYASCGSVVIVFKGQLLERLINKEKNGDLTDAEKSILNRQRFLIRHQLRTIENKDHLQFIAARLTVPILVFATSWCVRNVFNQLCKRMKWCDYSNNYLIVALPTQIIGTCLTITGEFLATMLLLRRFYQYRQHVSDSQIDPVENSPEVVAAGIKYLKQLASNDIFRTNLAEFFLFEGKRDFNKRIQLLENYYEKVNS